jgi:hypothetical protein
MNFERIGDRATPIELTAQTDAGAASWRSPKG